MKSRKRFVLPLLAIVALLAIAGAWWWDGAHKARAQIITLPNGERYQFAGTTYSTRNWPPVLGAQFLGWLREYRPTWARKFFKDQMAKWPQAYKSDSPQLYVWFKRLQTNALSTDTVFEAWLADQVGVEAGVKANTSFSSSGWAYAAFSAVPKRSRILKYNLYTPGSPSSGKAPTLFESIPFPNPIYGRHPQWPAESGPAVTMAGDVEVRLDFFGTGHGISGPSNRRTNGSAGIPLRLAKAGEDRITEFDLSLIPPKDSSEAWVPHRAELSDATGNIIGSRFLPTGVLVGDAFYRPKASSQTGYSQHVGGLLWPDETAWRLKLEIKRGLGFRPEEIVTFKNVPVPPVGTSNSIPITNAVGGIPIVLGFERGRTFASSPAMPGFTSTYTFITVDLPTKPSGVIVDFVKMTTDTGEQLRVEGNNWPPYGHTISLPTLLPNAKTVDITFVVQKTRTVEFLVKPPKPE